MFRFSVPEFTSISTKLMFLNQAPAVPKPKPKPKAQAAPKPKVLRLDLQYLEWWFFCFTAKTQASPTVFLLPGLHNQINLSTIFCILRPIPRWPFPLPQPSPSWISRNPAMPLWWPFTTLRTLPISYRQILATNSIVVHDPMGHPLIIQKFIPFIKSYLDNSYQIIYNPRFPNIPLATGCSFCIVPAKLIIIKNLKFQKFPQLKSCSTCTMPWPIYACISSVDLINQIILNPNHSLVLPDPQKFIDVFTKPNRLEFIQAFHDFITLCNISDLDLTTPHPFTHANYSKKNILANHLETIITKQAVLWWSRKQPASNTKHMLTLRNPEHMDKLTYSAIVGWLSGWPLAAILTPLQNVWIHTLIYYIKHRDIKDGVYRTYFNHSHIPALTNDLLTRPR